MLTVLQLFPIKSLQPVRVNAARVLASGALEFDRRWALVDARSRFVSGKNRPEICSIRATYNLARLEVELDGRAFSLERDGRAIAAWFSARLGETIEWAENVEFGFPDDTEASGPTFVSAASIARVAEWFQLPVDDVRRRFRANVEFDGVEAFWEDRLYGSRFRVGDVDVDVVNPCQRCVVPSRDALTGSPDAGFQKRFAELREMQMPAFAVTGQFNHYYRFAVNTRIPRSQAGKVIRVGDPITF